MSGLRFKVGELAIFQFSITGIDPQDMGELCEVAELGPYPIGSFTTKGPTTRVCDYLVQFADGSCRYCTDIELRKIDPPAEPASLTRESECEVEV